MPPCAPRSARFIDISRCAPPVALSQELDGVLRGCLRAVELEYLATRKAGFDQVRISDIRAFVPVPVSKLSEAQRSPHGSLMVA